MLPDKTFTVAPVTPGVDLQNAQCAIVSRTAAGWDLTAVDAAADAIIHDAPNKGFNAAETALMSDMNQGHVVSGEATVGMKRRFLTTDATIAIGDLLASAGGGLVKKHAGAAKVVGKAFELPRGGYVVGVTVFEK